MANYITEDDIKVSLINILKSDEIGYNFIQCDSNPNLKEDLNDGTRRTSKKQCVLPEIEKGSLQNQSCYSFRKYRFCNPKIVTRLYRQRHGKDQLR